MQNHLFKELLIDKENLFTSLIRGLADFFLGYLHSESNPFLPVLMGRFLVGLL